MDWAGWAGVGTVGAFGCAATYSILAALLSAAFLSAFAARLASCCFFHAGVPARIADELLDPLVPARLAPPPDAPQPSVPALGIGTFLTQF